MNYLNYRVGKYSFTQDWVSAEALAVESTQRELGKNWRKEDDFKSRPHEVRKIARVEDRNRQAGARECTNVERCWWCWKTHLEGVLLPSVSCQR